MEDFAYLTLASNHFKDFLFQAYELSTLTGTQVMLLVASETGHVYTFATRKLQPMITSDAGKALIQVGSPLCLILARIEKPKFLGQNARERIWGSEGVNFV